jgi:hypothetical protein
LAPGLYNGKGGFLSAELFFCAAPILFRRAFGMLPRFPEGVREACDAFVF